MRMDVELEHGTQHLQISVTDGDTKVTAKIARAHRNEFPDYYSRLAVMEAEAEAYWGGQAEQHTVIGTGPDDLILAAAKNCPVEAITVGDSETGLHVYP
jgi:ferredoxin